MRLVQLTVPTGSREAITGVLDDREIDYVVTEETSSRRYTAVIYFPLPKAAVEPVLDELGEQGVPEDAYTVVLEAETVISRRFDRLKEAYESDDVDEDRIARQELLSEAQSLTPTRSIYVAMTIISAVVATAGLFLDSPAVVVGSMVIAPLIGPALGASVGSVLNDETLFRKSLVYQALGVGLAIAAATFFALLVNVTNIVPSSLELTEVGEINERLAPDLLALAIALGAGIAGMVSISTGLATALVGVMIAAALIPPAAAAGIAIAWGEPAAALGATTLVFVNVLSVNLAGLVTLWYAGYRPEGLWNLGPTESRVRRRVIGLVVIVGIFALFLGGITYASYQVSTFEQDAREEVEAVLAEDDAAQLLDLSVELDESLPVREPSRVIVTVGAPPGEVDPTLAAAIRERVAEQAASDVSVQVRYIAIAEADPPATGADNETNETAESVEPPVPRAPTGPPRIGVSGARPVLGPGR
ncbi:TIGR00341 family protein [Halovivax ruber XH-70]|uniref:TIGR00341 family protein n=1 Tax=Halovivax ruber (strain DSM 18193 / JCM 13892 / XH-70) TaxID=797302 RepID=L0IEY5_HALRX|nr:TIGR00341 family protein [Halovivax ruber]AGB17304.1 TIGR00341 family protein [Halovivax ruber XH-70]